MLKINEMATIAGISTRTLRYYDKIGLLRPNSIDHNGYRLYDDKNIDELQQILFYKELGYSLEKISHIVNTSSFNRLDSLYEQLTHLNDKKEHIESVIDLVMKTIDTIERGETMSNKEKFEAWKKEQIHENTAKYGNELNEKYDTSFIQKANQQYLKKSKYEMKQQEALTKKLNQAIIDAMDTHDPSSEKANQMCELHKEWICFYWPSYSKESHLALVEMYTLDERFTKYYDKIRVGAAQFLLDAMKLYVTK